MRSETGKLPKGQSYPLKPSRLEAALADAGICIDTDLARRPGRLFDALFWPPSPNVPYERLYIRIGSVPSEQAAEARSRMEEVILPRLIEWIANILAQDVRSPVRRKEQWIGLRPL